MTSFTKSEAAAIKSHDWAVDIVENRFVEGIERLLEPSFVARRYQVFRLRADPVYDTLLDGLSGGVAEAFVTNWTLAHTLATESRAWLEDIVVDLLKARAQRSDLPPPEIYSLRMLAGGWLETGRTIWNVGENWRAELSGRAAWRAPITRAALDEIDRIVSEEEREYDDYRSKATSDEGLRRFTRLDDSAAKHRCASALDGPFVPAGMKCNLLVLEPEFRDRRPHAWAVRFINPTLMNRQSTVRDERVNVLRLYAWIVQSKPFRAPTQITVAAADLLPRSQASEHGSSRFHFTAETRWEASQLWTQLAVPFAAVTAGVRRASTVLHNRLRDTILGLIPPSHH